MFGTKSQGTLRYATQREGLLRNVMLEYLNRNSMTVIYIREQREFCDEKFHNFSLLEVLLWS